jgi:uncharacterized protein with PIN domain
VAVPCSGCGRAYDIALFQFGRTLHCACGQRVALTPRVEPVAPPGDPRFLADAMLGRLARWLRVIGADTVWEPDIADAAVARRAYEEDRIVLTRDRSLPEEWRLPRVLLLESDAPLEQLRQVADRYGLEWRGRLFRRCSLCNAGLVPVEAAAVRDRVPERVAREQTRFAECRGCRRVYWEGSHTRRMRRILERALG